MSEQYQEGRRPITQLDIFIRWLNRFVLSIIDWGSTLDPINYFYRYDRRTRRYEYFISHQEIAYNLIVISISATAFGAGIAQCIAGIRG